MVRSYIIAIERREKQKKRGKKRKIRQKTIVKKLFFFLRRISKNRKRESSIRFDVNIQENISFDRNNSLRNKVEQKQRCTHRQRKRRKKKILQSSAEYINRAGDALKVRTCAPLLYSLVCLPRFWA